jgi:hypothetical protein
MAFTFSNAQADPVTGFYTCTATTDATSAAGTFYPGFKPRYVRVLQVTTPAIYEFVDGMAAGTMIQQIAAGTTSLVGTNGITVVGGDSATPAQAAVTLGTGCHTNSATFRIVCYK